MKKTAIILAVITTFIATGCGFAVKDDYQGDDLETIAKCLTEKGAILYGAVWCPHCTDQKESFGDALKFINYVECDPNTNLEQSKICLEKKIEALPTWDLPSGERITGNRPVSELADLAGC
ncbi:hypothetical protein KKD70_02445 [Patescibacteria group bacterium]|nr:hypothetical protein [Patescibacteria group bacterium]